MIYVVVVLFALVAIEGVFILSDKFPERKKKK
jgi:hypothetical protein